MPYPAGLDSTVTQTQVTTRVTPRRASNARRGSRCRTRSRRSPSTASSSGRWVWDTENRVIWSANDDMEGLTYTVDQPRRRSRPRRSCATPRRWTRCSSRSTPPCPRTPRRSSRRPPRTPCAGRATPYEKAVKLQKFFQSGAFTYKLDPVLNPQDPLGSFLKNKEASASSSPGTYAAMARTLGLPTRVVVGFVPGDQTQGSNQWTVTSHDTHAWPEVFFENVGWVRFEPTPRSGRRTHAAGVHRGQQRPAAPGPPGAGPDVASAGSSPGASAGIPRGVPGVRRRHGQRRGDEQPGPVPVGVGARAAAGRRPGS